MNVIEFPKTITEVNLIREYNQCVDAVNTRNKELEQIGTEINELNQKCKILAFQANVISTEITSITYRMMELQEKLCLTQ